MLARCMRTCRLLQTLAGSEDRWQQHVQAQVPGTQLKSPSPYSSFRQLYSTHDKYWFLPRHRIWFSDARQIGNVAIMRYDYRRGCIEGYRLLVERLPTPVQSEVYEDNPAVVIWSFKPRVHLFLDNPLVHRGVDTDQLQKADMIFARQLTNKLYDTMASGMAMLSDLGGFTSRASLMLTRGVQQLEEGTQPDDVWPPLIIPAEQRSVIKASWLEEAPASREDICQTAFTYSRFLVTPNGLLPGRGLVKRFSVRRYTLISDCKLTDPFRPWTPNYIPQHPSIHGEAFGWVTLVATVRKSCYSISPICQPSMRTPLDVVQILVIKNGKDR